MCVGNVWDPGAPAAMCVPPFLGLTGGGPHHAVARAFVRPRRWETYVLLLPCHPSSSAFLWPPAHPAWTARPRGDDCDCPLLDPYPRRRPIEVTVEAVDRHTYLAPRVLPARLRSALQALRQLRTLRACPCLLSYMEVPTLDVHVGVFRATLPAGPVPGPQLWMALTSTRVPELLVASLEGYVDAADEPAGAFHWIPFPAAPPRLG